MTNFFTRIRLIYVPFLLVTFLFISIYTFLNWIFVIWLEIPLNEDVVNFWLPFALPWIPVLIWLRPRIKLLVLKDKKGNLPFLYSLIAAIAISVPALLAQQFLETASGKLTVLQNISQLTKPLTKYYELKHYNIDKTHAAIYQRSATSGKNNEYLDFYIDVACPILTEPLRQDTVQLADMPGETKPIIIIDGAVAGKSFNLKSLRPASIKSTNVIKGSVAMSVYGKAARNGVILISTYAGLGLEGDFFSPHVPRAWLCLEFDRHISNNFTDDRKEAEYKEFISGFESEFKDKDLSQFVYLDRIPVNDRRNGYLKAIKRVIDKLKDPVLFEAKNEPYEARNGNKLGWIFKSFAIGAAVWLLMIIIPKVNSPELKKLPQNPLKDNLNTILNFLTVFKPQSKFQITAIIICLNSLLFIIMVLAGLGFVSFDGHDLLNWGADYRPVTTNDEWWRLITSVFLHGGFMHLLMNMYGLFFAAIFLEPLLGRLKYATAYLLCGIVSSLASIWWHPATVSIGASGAIFGLYGVLAAFLTIKKIDLPARTHVLYFSAIFIVLNLILGLFGNTDNAAHLGGVLCGIILGYYFYFFTDLPQKTVKKEKKEPHSVE